MCSVVIKNVNKAVLIQTFMSDVSQCFAFKNKIKFLCYESVLSSTIF